MATTFKTRLGLLAATVGSAVGLGNVWRFPAETHANGGAAFLIVYIACMLLLGIPAMIAEFVLGRGGKSDAINVFGKLTPRSPYRMAGIMPILSSFLILAFYMVVAGWTFEYLIQSLSGNLFDIKTSGASELETSFHYKMEQYVATVTPPLLNLYIVLIINFLIIWAGVQKGIERLSNIMMPLLFALMLLFCVVSLSLPGAVAGLDFLFRPDFSKITPAVVVNALGQAFFSLSLGMGVLITYSAYYPQNTNLVKTAYTVSGLDLLVSLMMGIIIFPAAASFNMTDANLRGTTLIFVTLPEIFYKMTGSQLWSTLFFLLLLIAAITSIVSICEVPVAWIQERYKKSRLTACTIVTLPLIVLCSLCSLSFSALSDVHILGMTIFEFCDTVSSNILLPTLSIIVCLYIGWKLPKSFFYKQITNDNTINGKMASAIFFVIKYLAPPLICIILICSFIEI